MLGLNRGCYLLQNLLLTYSSKNMSQLKQSTKEPRGDIQDVLHQYGVQRQQNAVIEKLMKFGFHYDDINDAIKEYGVVFECDEDINNLIELIQRKHSKPIPEYVPMIPKIMQSINPDDDKDEEIEPNNAMPLPEVVRSNKSNHNKKNDSPHDDDDNDDDDKDEDIDIDSDETVLEDEEGRQMDGIVQHNLGSAFAGEMLKRLRESKRKKNCGYYFYVNELITRIHAPIICDCITQLHADEANEFDWRLLTKWIVDFLSIPREDTFWMCSRLNRVIEGKIIMALLHPDISNEYMIRKINILKVTQCNETYDGGNGMFQLHL